MIIVVTPYVMLEDRHIHRLIEIERDIHGVILRTPMSLSQLEQWIEKLLAAGFPKSKVIIHSDVQLAKKIGIFNVHFREGDARAAYLKRQEGARYQVSMSTHSASQVRNAHQQRLDFVLFGHLFPTASKPNMPPRSSDEIEAVLAIDFPVVALGGINAETIQQVSPRFAGVACLSSAFSNQPQTFEQIVKQWTLKKVK